jgi:hypothetical protein
MAVGGRRSIWGHNNQPKVGVGDGRDIGEGARQRQNVCGGRFAIVWGGKLSGKNKQKKIRRGLRWPQNDVKKHNNQPKMSGLDGGEMG